MRLLAAVVLGFLSGALGAAAGWLLAAMAAVALLGPDRDGAVAMAALFQVGPFGGVVGFALGVAAFWRLGFSRRRAPPALEGVAPRAPISRPFATIVLLTCGGLACWYWWEFIRSPYLSHGYMNLALQFRLPADMAPPAEAKDLQVDVTEGDRAAYTSISDYAWLGHDGNRPVILASASLMYKTSSRTVSLTLPGQRAEVWTLELPSDPDPMRGFSNWRLANRNSTTKIELSYRLEGN
jgi:hypothetical protein